MGRSATYLTLIALLVTTCACKRKMPVICRLSPPEDFRNYQRYADDWAAAKCDERIAEELSISDNAASWKAR